MIEFKNIVKNFGTQTVLNDISFKIEKGHVCGIIGPSGTGKSVTLRHIIGLLKPTSGEILIDSINVPTANNKELTKIRENLGILFQSGALLNWLTIFDNVALPLREKKILKENAITEKVNKTLDLVGLGKIGHKMPSEISGGMKKRAGLARAIINQPDILLYDEPTSGLDPVSSRKIDQLIKTISDELNTTSIVVTHDLVSAYAICHQLIMLYQGKVIFNGTPQEFNKSNDPIIKEFINAQFKFEIRNT